MMHILLRLFQKMQGKTKGASAAYSWKCAYRIYRFFEEFSDRILYGCDICAVTNQHQYMFSDFLNKMMDEKAVSVDTYRKIVRENAIKLLKL
jgi:predicted TIM-barrel fold metal-dependent hydrolase